MIILDTDCVSLLQRENILKASKLRENLGRFSVDEIFTTIITFEEQMRGWLAYINRDQSIEHQIFGYKKLHAALNDFKVANVLDFNEAAASFYKQLKADKVRIGTMDLKIASIALANDAILVSRNLSDFEQVPSLRVQDWT
ncbi:MAG: type II toxin-antitoxin system VapC family toxin [Acidobacteria bacterium]|nr:type II toxin-antitoxin system VapC family toxin [Acidobacteriota bacterium]